MNEGDVINRIVILIANHNGSSVPVHPLLRSIQVGAALTDKRFQDTLKDNEGANISERNASYCEMTAVYWAWKNIDADYIGLFHYRRYLCFSHRKKTRWDGYIHLSGPDENTEKQLNLNSNKMQTFIEKYDIIAIKPFIVYNITGGGCLTVKQQFQSVSTHRIQDLNKAIEILLQFHPEYSKDVTAYLNAERGWFCNMFIMKRERFELYCEWIFPILDELYSYQQKTYAGEEGRYEGRMVGFLAERLQGIYFTHLLRTEKHIKIGYLPPVLFDEKNTNEKRPLPLYKWILRRQFLRMKKRKEL